MWMIGDSGSIREIGCVGPIGLRGIKRIKLLIFFNIMKLGLYFFNFLVLNVVSFLSGRFYCNFFFLVNSMCPGSLMFREAKYEHVICFRGDENIYPSPAFTVCVLKSNCI